MDIVRLRRGFLISGGGGVDNIGWLAVALGFTGNPMGLQHAPRYHSAKRCWWHPEQARVDRNLRMLESGTPRRSKLRKSALCVKSTQSTMETCTF